MKSGRKARRVALDVRGLTGREEVFRLSGTARRHRAVEVWLTSGPAELKALARKWFARLRACGPDVRELIHDGCPVACADDAAFAYVNVFKSHVNVGFFHGAQLADPAGLLEGSGKRMRHVKLDPVRDLDAAALETLIDAAYADVKARLAAEGVIA